MEFLKHLLRVLKVLNRFPCVVFVLESKIFSTSYLFGFFSSSRFWVSLAFISAGSSITIWNTLVLSLMVLGSASL